MTSGIHHVTLITRRVQANVDFYVGFLGLQLVKRTGGFEDGTQLHLIYGDATGSPGSLITFLVWEDGAPGRVGNGQVSEVAFAVPTLSIGDWLTRAIEYRIPIDAPIREFDEAVLRLKDPDGVIIKLVGVNLPVSNSGTDAAPMVGRLHAVTILTEKPDETAAFVGRFGYRPAAVSGSVRRLQSDTDVVDIRDATGYVPGSPGSGTADHLAFRAADVAAVRAAENELSLIDALPTNVHDRKYFTSLYVREPGGTLLELATDGPGVAVDEPEDRLGEILFVPPHDAERAEDLRVMLPQFALPGAERLPMRDLPFVHRFHTPDDPDGSVIVLLHGTGGSEADLMPMAHRIAPRATLLGVRGRSHEEGTARWFRRLTATSFDQADIRGEAEAFEAFVEGAVTGYGLDHSQMTFLGYSNGANFAAAVLALNPGVIRRAILIRVMAVLEDIPESDLTGTEVLMLNGTHDPYDQYASVLENLLRSKGADLEARLIEAGHELTSQDTAEAKSWLQSRRFPQLLVKP